MSEAASTSRPPAMGLVGPAALLAFTAGFVDTCGFIALLGLFTAHVTGNFVLIGASLVEQHEGIVGKLLALPVFVVAVAAAHFFVLRRERGKRDAAAPLLTGQIALLGMFLLTGVAASPVVDGDAPLAVLAGMLGVTAMAVQNAASRTVFGALPPSTVMTGNVTQVVIDLVDIASAGRGAAEPRARLRKMAPAVAAFAVGALAGALGYRALGFACLIAPMLTVGAVLFLCLRRRRYGFSTG